MADENETERDDDASEGQAEARPQGNDADEDTSSDGGSTSSDGSSDEGDAKRSRDEERELQRDAEQQAREQENLREDELPIAGLLGLERWVQFAFVAMAVVLVFVTDKLVTFVWEQVGSPDDTIVTITAVAVGLAGTFLAYRNDRVRDFATEVVTELSKVTWPTREETWYSTLVVISASVIAAVYTGVFDALWSALTDYVYSAG